MGTAVAETLAPIKAKYDELMGDKGYLDSIFKKNALRARELSEPMIDDVYKKIGFVR